MDIPAVDTRAVDKLREAESLQPVAVDMHLVEDILEQTNTKIYI